MNAARPLEIVGGGLAGLSLGLALQRAGIPVTLHEAGSYPRHRVCGEFITGLRAETIETLGLAPMLGDALTHRSVAWFRGDTPEPFRIQRLPQPARGISRYALDARLARAFTDAGGDLREKSSIVSRLPREGRIYTTGRRRSTSHWLGLKIHVRGYRPAADLEVHLGEHAYVGCSAVEDGAHNICGLFRNDWVEQPGAGRKVRHLVLIDYLRAVGLQRLAAAMAASEIETESFAAVTALTFERSPSQDRERFTLGDATAMIPPFTGNGMAIALESAAIACGPLTAYGRGTTTWEEAQRSIAVAVNRRFRLRLAAANLVHPFLWRPPLQRWFAWLNGAHLLPFRPIYAALH